MTILNSNQPAKDLDIIVEKDLVEIPVGNFHKLLKHVAKLNSIVSKSGYPDIKVNEIDNSTIIVTENGEDVIIDTVKYELEYPVVKIQIQDLTYLGMKLKSDNNKEVYTGPNADLIRDNYGNIEKCELCGDVNDIRKKFYYFEEDKGGVKRPVCFGSTCVQKAFGVSAHCELDKYTTMLENVKNTSSIDFKTLPTHYKIMALVYDKMKSGSPVINIDPDTTPITSYSTVNNILRYARKNSITLYNKIINTSYYKIDSYERIILGYKAYTPDTYSKITNNDMIAVPDSSVNTGNDIIKLQFFKSKGVINFKDDTKSIVSFWAVDNSMTASKGYNDTLKIDGQNFDIKDLKNKKVYSFRIKKEPRELYYFDKDVADYYISSIELLDNTPTSFTTKSGVVMYEKTANNITLLSKEYVNTGARFGGFFACIFKDTDGNNYKASSSANAIREMNVNESYDVTYQVKGEYYNKKTNINYNVINNIKL